MASGATSARRSAARGAPRASGDLASSRRHSRIERCTGSRAAVRRRRVASALRTRAGNHRREPRRVSRVADKRRLHARPSLRFQNTSTHPEKGSVARHSLATRASPSTPQRKSTASIAPRIRICGVTWITPRTSRCCARRRPSRDATSRTPRRALCHRAGRRARSGSAAVRRWVTIAR